MPAKFSLPALHQTFMPTPTVYALKIKAIAWLALPIILVSSQLEGNLEVIISKPLMLQISKLNKARRDKVAYPSSQSHFRMKRCFSLSHDSLYYTTLSTEQERKVRQRWPKAFL